MTINGMSEEDFESLDWMTRAQIRAEAEALRTFQSIGNGKLKQTPVAQVNKKLSVLKNGKTKKNLISNDYRRERSNVSSSLLFHDASKDMELYDLDTVETAVTLASRTQLDESDSGEDDTLLEAQKLLGEWIENKSEKDIEFRMNTYGLLSSTQHQQRDGTNVISVRLHGHNNYLVGGGGEQQQRNIYSSDRCFDDEGKPKKPEEIDYSSEDAASIVQKMYVKAAIDPKVHSIARVNGKGGNIGSSGGDFDEGSGGEQIDIATRMELRHQLVKERRLEVDKAHFRQKAIRKEEKETRRHAEQLLLREKRQLAALVKAEEAKEKQEHARQRYELDKQERERKAAAALMRKRAKDEEQKRKVKEAAEVHRIRLAELDRKKRIELNRRELVKQLALANREEDAHRLRCMQRHFAAWKKLFIMHNAYAQQVVRAFSIKTLLAHWNAWRIFTLNIITDRQAAQAASRMILEKEQEAISSRHFCRRTLLRYLVAWRAFTRSERDRVSVEAAHVAKVEKMNHLLQKAKLGELKKSKTSSTVAVDSKCDDMVQTKTSQHKQLILGQKGVPARQPPPNATLPVAPVGMMQREEQRRQRQAEINRLKAEKAIADERRKEEEQCAKDEAENAERCAIFERRRNERRALREKELEIERRRARYSAYCAKADCHYRLAQMRYRVFIPLKRAVERRKKLEDVSRQYWVRLLFRRWRCITESHHLERERRAVYYHQNMSLCKAFKIWRTYWAECTIDATKARIYHRSIILRRHFSIWCEISVAEAERNRLIMFAKEDKAVDHWKKVSLTKAFGAWQLFIPIIQQLHESEIRREELRNKVSRWLPDFGKPSIMLE